MSNARSELLGLQLIFIFLHVLVPSNTLIVHNADHQCVHKLDALEDVNATTEDTESPLGPIEIEGGNINSFSDLKIGMTWGLYKIMHRRHESLEHIMAIQLKDCDVVIVGHIDSGKLSVYFLFMPSTDNYEQQFVK
ncbi:unnamed protein product [Orchesella dallaii]|uniref:Uncharacterized protein n=1 Tax=Orchesella dallaii TaxID=48710 RepID=A0ABP1R0G6_9HEXA